MTTESSGLAEGVRATVAVTGATGFVGRHVVQKLVDHGYGVRALYRDQQKAIDALPVDGVTPVRGDVFDRGAMEELVSGCDAIVHLVGIRLEVGRSITYERMHVEATQRVIDAAQKQCVWRLVHMSALGVRPESRAEYQTSKFRAETLVRRSPLDWTIFRPSLIVGAGGEFNALVEGWATGHEPPHKFMPYFFRNQALPGELTLSGRAQPVHVDDVARAVVESIDCEDASGEVYELGGPDAMNWIDLLNTMKQFVPRANPKIKPKGVSGEFAHYGALAAQKLGAGRFLPFGPSEPIMAMDDNTCEIAKARAHLRFDPLSLEACLRGEAAHA